MFDADFENQRWKPRLLLHVLDLLIPVDFCPDNSTEVAAWCAHPFHFPSLLKQNDFFCFANYMLRRWGVSLTLIEVSGDFGCLATHREQDLPARFSFLLDCFLVHTQNSIPFISVHFDLYKSNLRIGHISG